MTTTRNTTDNGLAYGILHATHVATDADTTFSTDEYGNSVLTLGGSRIVMGDDYGDDESGTLIGVSWAIYEAVQVDDERSAWEDVTSDGTGVDNIVAAWQAVGFWLTEATA